MNQSEFFLGIAASISSSLDIGEALRNTYSFLEKLIPVEMLGLFYYDFDLESLFCLADVGKRGSFLFLEEPRNCGLLPPASVTPVGAFTESSFNELPTVDLMSKREMNWYSENSPYVSREYHHFLGGSLLRLWLHLNDNMIGTLVIGSSKPEIFSSRLIAWFESVRDPITVAMSNARRYRELLVLKSRLEEDNQELHHEMRKESGLYPVGSTFGLRDVMSKVQQVAQQKSPVLLLGETGTGKEVIANTIHHLSNRRDKPMIKVQCGAVPESLLDSELFGHEKGAFTGAITSHRGRFERAHGGTLFLDEIGELTPGAQVKLLRVLQEHVIERLGGTRSIEVDVRVIAATNRNLENMIERGLFREDLWFRLNVFPIRIPPLRYRKEDIPSLVNHFLAKKAAELNLSQKPFLEHKTIKSFVQYHWPGNVRELQNVIERALILKPGPYLDVPEFLLTDQKQRHSVEQSVFPERDDGEIDGVTLDDVQRDHIEKVLRHCRGKVSGSDGAAEILGMNPSTLRARMRKLGIQFGRITY